MSHNQVPQNPMTLPTADINTQPAPIQISTEAVRLDANPSVSVPQLSGFGSPNTTQGSGTSFDSQLKLPEITSPGQQGGAIELPEITIPQQSNQLELPAIGQPEIAVRQPVSTAASTRDEGLIDALSLDSNDSPAFKPEVTADPSFNTLAGALDNGTDRAVKTADGLLGNSATDMPSTPVQNPKAITAVWAEVDRLIEADEYRKALGTLSKHYGCKGLTGPQQQKLQGWLDALAGKVIYSTEHHFIRQPYVVQRGDNLASIATKLKIPAEVIYNINRAQFGSSNEVSPGMTLKVVNGPFHAEVNLETKMMTLFVKNLYAGRFPVAMGISGKPDQGNYRVMVKSPAGFTWRDAQGKEYPAGTPGNGYGPYWMGLTGSLCIHAVANGTTDGHPGCIGLSESDAKDIYGILSKDSQISIVR